MFVRITSRSGLRRSSTRRCCIRPGLASLPSISGEEVTANSDSTDCASFQV